MQDLGLQVLFEGRNLWRLLEGLGVTISIAGLSMILSVVLGIFVGLAMCSRRPWLRTVMRLYLETVRIMPQLVLLFIAYFGFARAGGVNLSGEMAAILVFTFWGAAEMGDLVRGAVFSVPAHQYESAAALGLSNRQSYRYIILPQTIKQLLPLTINLSTRMVKTTSLIALIGVVEVLKVGQQIIDANRFDFPTAALWIYGVIFFLYFLVCYPLSIVARRLEKKWATQ